MAIYKSRSAPVVKFGLVALVLISQVNPSTCYPAIQGETGNAIGNAAGGSKCPGVMCIPPPAETGCEAKYEAFDKCCPTWVCSNGQTAHGAMMSSSKSWQSGDGSSSAIAYSRVGVKVADDSNFNYNFQSGGAWPGFRGAEAGGTQNLNIPTNFFAPPNRFNAPGGSQTGFERQAFQFPNIGQFFPGLGEAVLPGFGNR